MSSTSLLSRQQELEAADRIERTRHCLRHCILSSEYVLQAAVGMLEKVLCGRMRLETTCESWCLSQEPQKRRLVATLTANVHTLRHLVHAIATDFVVAVSRCYSVSQRRQARRRLLLRRAKAVRLVEESPVRRPFLQVVLNKLKEISRRHGHGDRRVGTIADAAQCRPASRSCQGIATPDADHVRHARHCCAVA